MLDGKKYSKTKILFIVQESLSANGICSDAVMAQMVHDGFSVFCLCDREYKHAPQNRVDCVVYHEVMPRLVSRINSFLRWSKVSGLRRRVLTLFSVIIDKIDHAFSIPWYPLISPLYAFRLTRTAKKIVRENDIQIVVSVYRQMDALVAGRIIKKKKKQILFIPYFLDTMAFAWWPPLFGEKWRERRILRWENYLMPYADTIVMMKSTENRYLSLSRPPQWFSKTIFLDIPLLKTQHKYSVSKNDGGHINLLFVGSLPFTIRNPLFFINAFHQIADENLRFTIVGSNSDDKYLHKLVSIDSRITTIPFVEHGKAVEMLQEADVLVNFGNNLVEMVPSKIFEYMSYGKPIISTAPIDNEPSIPYLQKYPDALILFDNKITIEQSVSLMKEFIYKKRLGTIDCKTLHQLFYDNTPTAFVGMLKKTMNLHSNESYEKLKN